MFFYPLILILQIFCVVHAYKNNSDQKWYWLIIFFPAIGSIIYLYHHFYNRENVESISEGLKVAVNRNYQVEKLEKKVNFSDSVLNKTNLANKYMEIGEYSKAIELYESCLNGIDRGNIDTSQKLIKCYFRVNDFGKAVNLGKKIRNTREFQSSEGHVCFSWSLFHLDNVKEAEENFVQMDSSYSNFPQRIEYSKFLNKTGRNQEAKNKLQELMDEYEQMSSYQRKNYRPYRKVIENTFAEFNKAN